jgi:hypothetical protein
MRHGGAFTGGKAAMPLLKAMAGGIRAANLDAAGDEDGIDEWSDRGVGCYCCQAD